jgi:alpha-ribazole phosphatase
MGTYRGVELYLVRHGLTLWNVQKKYLGHTDLGLLENKKWQLDELRTELKQMPFDHVFSSDLRRCQETITYIYPDSSFDLEPRLREINFGEWEGKTYDELKYEGRYSGWLNNWEEAAPPNGETGIDFKARINSFLEDVLQKQGKQFTSSENQHQSNKKKSTNIEDKVKKILIVTHGGVIRHILSRFNPEHTFWQWKITHGKGYHLSLTWQEGDWQCNSWSEVPTQEKEELFVKK